MPSSRSIRRMMTKEERENTRNKPKKYDGHKSNEKSVVRKLARL